MFLFCFVVRRLLGVVSISVLRNESVLITKFLRKMTQKEGYVMAQCMVVWFYCLGAMDGQNLTTGGVYRRAKQLIAAGKHREREERTRPGPKPRSHPSHSLLLLGFAP